MLNELFVSELQEAERHGAARMNFSTVQRCIAKELFALILRLIESLSLASDSATTASGPLQGKAYWVEEGPLPFQITSPASCCAGASAGLAEGEYLFLFARVAVRICNPQSRGKEVYHRSCVSKRDMRLVKEAWRLE